MKTLLKISLFFLLLTQIQYSQWIQVGPSGLTIYSLATSGSNVFAGTYLDGLYRSTDDGQTWTQTPLSTGTIMAVAINGSYILAGDAGGIHISYDNGQTWTQTALDFTTVFSIIVDGSNIFVGTQMGLFISSDEAQTWTQLGLNNEVVHSLAITGSNIFAGTYWGNGVYRSTDYGQTWVQTSLDSIGIKSIAANGPNVVAGTWEEGLYYSTNYGETWSHTWALFDVPTLLCNSTFVFAGSNGVYRSTSDGQTWTNISQGLPGGYFVLSLSISEEYIYAGMVLGYSVWRRPLIDIVPVELTSFTASLVNSEVVLSWTTATEVSNQMFEIERATESDDFRTIGYVDGQGTTTQQQSYGYTDKTPDVGINYYRLKQIDFDGTFEYSNVVEIEVTTPTFFLLEQNYPNPFNPSTIISWQSPVGSRQALKIYDLLGNEVATLVDEYKPAGSYEVDFDASGLSSGIYFYKLQAGNFVATKKMILMK